MTPDERAQQLIAEWHAVADRGETPVFVRDDVSLRVESKEAMERIAATLKALGEEAAKASETFRAFTEAASSIELPVVTAWAARDEAGSLVEWVNATMRPRQRGHYTYPPPKMRRGRR